MSTQPCTRIAPLNHKQGRFANLAAKCLKHAILRVFTLILVILAACGGEPDSSGNRSSISSAADTAAQLLQIYPNLSVCLSNMDLPLAQITSITCEGGKDFSGLERLSKLHTAVFNNTEEFFFSSPVKLAKLYIKAFKGMTSSQLDLSGFEELSELHIDQTPGIETFALSDSSLANLRTLSLSSQVENNLQIPDLPGLKNLSITHSSVTQMTLKNLPALSSLDLQYNFLLDLDISDLSNLEYLNLKQNLLSDLDLLAHPDLKRVDLQYNAITSLALPQNKPELDLKLAANPVYCSFVQELIELFAHVNLYDLIGDSVCQQDQVEIDYSDFLASISFPNAQLTQCVRSTGYAKVSQIQQLTCNASELTGINQLLQLEDLSLSNPPQEQISLLSELPLKTLTLKNLDNEQLDLSSLPDLEQLTIENAPQLSTLYLEDNNSLNELALAYTPRLASLTLADDNSLKAIVARQLPPLQLERFTQLRSLEVLGNPGELDPSYFTELERLVLNNYEGTLLDLTAFTKLNVLSVSFAEVLSEIILPAQGALVEIFLYQNAELEQIDLSEQSRLSYFESINNVKLANLILNQESSVLSKLRIENSGLLSAVDLSLQTELEHITIRNTALNSLVVPSSTLQLHVRDNQLSALELSASELLQRLDLANNKVTQLNLSDSPSLIDLNADKNPLLELNLTNNLALKYLSLNNNSDLFSLDIENNHALERLSLKNTLISELRLPDSENLALVDLRGNVNICSDLDSILTPQNSSDLSYEIVCDP